MYRVAELAQFETFVLSGKRGEITVNSRYVHGLLTRLGRPRWLDIGRVLFACLQKKMRGTERELRAPGTALRICHVHESYF